MEFMNRQEVIDRAFKHVVQQVRDNQELFLAQIIKMNPEIDLLKYQVCYQPLPNFNGNKFWLEEIKSTF